MAGLNVAMVYRGGFLLATVTLTLVAWGLVGGSAGAMLWIGGFLALWGATRLVNAQFAGFFLGDETLPEQHDEDQSFEEAPLTDDAVEGRG